MIGVGALTRSPRPSSRGSPCMPPMTYGTRAGVAAGPSVRLDRRFDVIVANLVGIALRHGGGWSAC